MVTKVYPKDMLVLPLGSATPPNCGKTLKVLTTKPVSKVSGGVC